MPRAGQHKPVIGIVGSEAVKFTQETEAAARDVIRELVARARLVVSGGCHLGGIDIVLVSLLFSIPLSVAEGLMLNQTGWNAGLRLLIGLASGGFTGWGCMVVVGFCWRRT